MFTIAPVLYATLRQRDSGRLICEGDRDHTVQCTVVYTPAPAPGDNRRGVTTIERPYPLRIATMDRHYLPTSADVDCVMDAN